MADNVGMEVLVVAAHPDDEVLGCGATLAKHARAGDRVFVQILGEGGTARAGRGKVGVKRVAELQRCAAKAAKVLKVKDLTMSGLPDNRFDGLELLEIVQHVERAIERYQPEVIYTHFWADLNVDHRLTCQAVVTAGRPMGVPAVRRVAAFEVLSSTEWSFGTVGPSFEPNVFERLDEELLEAKVEAMSCYPRELREWPHPRSPEGIEVLARRRGSQCGAGLAEAFTLIREVIL